MTKPHKRPGKPFSFTSSTVVRVLALLLLIAAILLTVVLSQKKTTIQQHASTQCSFNNLSLTPRTGNPGSSFNFTVSYNCPAPSSMELLCGVGTSRPFNTGMQNNAFTVSLQNSFSYNFSGGLPTTFNCDGFSVVAGGYTTITIGTISCPSCNQGGGGGGTYYWNECRGNACVNIAHSSPGGSNQCYPAGSTSNNGCSSGGGGGNCTTLSQYTQCAKTTQGCVQNYPSGDLVHVTHTSCGYTCTDLGRVPNQCGVPPAGTQCNNIGDGSACTSSCSSGQYCESLTKSCNSGIPVVNVYVCNSANQWQFKYPQTGSYHNTCPFSCQNNGGGGGGNGYTKYTCGNNGGGRCVLNGGNTTAYPCSQLGTNWTKLYKDNDPANPHACQTQTKSTNYKCCYP